MLTKTKKKIKEKFIHGKVNFLDGEGLKYLRQEIFSLSFKILVVFATPLFAFSLYRMMVQKNYMAMVIDALFILTYLLLIFIKAIPDETKNIIMIMSVYAIGFVFIFRIGAETSGFIVFLSAIIYTAFMVDKKNSLRIILLSILVSLSLSLALFSGGLDDQPISLHKGSWIINISMLYSYGLGIFLLIRIMVSGLNKQAGLIKEANKKISFNRKRYQAMIENISDVIVITDGRGKVRYISPNVREVYGWEKEEFLNRPLLEKIYKEDQQKAALVFQKLLKEGQAITKIRHSCKNGEIKNLEVTLRNLLNDPLIGGILINFHDITERLIYEEKIIYINHHDSLTGLYNRNYFNKIQKELGSEEYLPLSLISADVDGLKMINDAFGHQAGDEVLKLSANFLRRSFRQEDIIARVGGDEFYILLPQTSSQVADALVERVNLACEHYNDKNYKWPHYLSLSMGVATKTEVNENLNEILQNADNKMYQAKNLRRKKLDRKFVLVMKRIIENKLPEFKEEVKGWSQIAREIGKTIGLSEQELRKLELLVIFADLGKISLDQGLLEKYLKGESLSEEEIKSYQKHPELGYRIAKATPILTEIAEYILTHEEKWDGSGYPQGLAGVDIPLLSRILALAKYYHQVKSGDKYRQGGEASKKGEVKKFTQTKFDPTLLEVLVNFR